MTLVKRIATLLSRNLNRRVIRAGSRFHKFLFQTLRLRRLNVISEDSLILTTRGRRTGRYTSTPLFYVEDGGRLYIAGSFAGSDQPPNWYLNLLAHPEVTVETRSSRAPFCARPLDGAEATLLWSKLLAIYPTFARYEKRTSRVIPVVELSPLTMCRSTEGAGRAVVAA